MKTRFKLEKGLSEGDTFFGEGIVSHVDSMAGIVMKIDVLSLDEKGRIISVHYKKSNGMLEEDSRQLSRLEIDYQEARKTVDKYNSTLEKLRGLKK